MGLEVEGGAHLNFFIGFEYDPIAGDAMMAFMNMERST